MAYEDNPPDHRRWLGVKIANARVQRNLSVSELSEAMAADGHSISESTLRDLERGVISSKWDTVCQVSDYLNLGLWGWGEQPVIEEHAEIDRALEVVSDPGLQSLLQAMKSHGSTVSVTIPSKAKA